MKLRGLVFLSFAAFGAFAAAASEIPVPILPAGVGLNIHFVTGHEKDLDLIAAAGFKFVRMDFEWTGIETNKGQYDWSAYDQLVANLDKRGLRAVFIFDYSHPLYEELVTTVHPITHQTNQATASPQHPESVAAFARWAAASAKHFEGHHVIWELWNEPNIQFWSPKPNVEQYSTLALATCKAVREAEPRATLIGPASSTFPWSFLEGFFKAGALEYLDAVSVHPYRDRRRAPETAAADYQRLRELIAQYAPAGKTNLPVISGEWGYSSHAKGVSLETQAAFAARQQLSNLLHGVPLSVWYDWQNDGPDPNENEHNFGIVYSDLSPKPAYLAIQTLTRQLNGYRIARRASLPNERDYVLVCDKPGGEQKLAAWTLDEPHTVDLPTDGVAKSKPTSVSSAGQPLSVTPESGRLVLELTPAPQYVNLGDIVLR